MTPTRREYFAATVGISSIFAGCLGGDGSTDAVKETTEVSMVGSQFEPRNIHVDTGATVTWTNEDGFEHTVTNASDNWSFDRSVPGGETAKFTFDDHGVYGVYCKIHGGPSLTGMSMKVGVGDASITDPLGADADGGGGGGY